MRDRGLRPMIARVPPAEREPLADEVLRQFVERHLGWLALERQAELEQHRQLRAATPLVELERRGLALGHLLVVDTEVAFGGGSLLVLQRSRGGDLPSHRFAPGDLVALSPQRGDGAPCNGVVAAVRRDRLRVVVDDDAEPSDLSRLDRLTSDVTFARQQTALRSLLHNPPPAGRRLRRALLGGEALVGEPAALLAPELDGSQTRAVAMALAADPLLLIQGPPGTGKTTVLVDWAVREIARGQRCLLTAPSNVAVDNLAERLADAGRRILRLGHPARVLPAVHRFTLAAVLDAEQGQRATRLAQRELQDLLRRLRGCSSRQERDELRRQVRALRGELRQMQEAAVRGALSGAEAILCTTTGAADPWLDEQWFDCVAVDEAAQATEAASWIPLLRGSRAVLVGDHRQLAPTVLSPHAGGLAESLFARLAAVAAPQTMLTTQYRMHRAIMAWPSAAYYDGRLQAAAAVAEHRLQELPGCTGAWPPLLWIDTAGCGADEDGSDAEGSKANPGEARIVAGHVRALLQAGVPARELAVITPYNAQVELLRREFQDQDGLEIGSVDGLQGREKEAVVLSLVRSNPSGEIGFLGDRRRLNVAITRARRHLCVVGDSATLSRDAHLDAWLRHLQQRAETRSAWDLLHGA